MSSSGYNKPYLSAGVIFTPQVQPLPQPCDSWCCRWRRNVLGALVCRIRGEHVLSAHASLSDPWCARCGNAR